MIPPSRDEQVGTPENGFLVFSSSEDEGLLQRVGINQVTS